MKLTVIPPAKPTYALELTHEELVLLGLLSYKWEVDAPTIFFHNLPLDVWNDVRLCLPLIGDVISMEAVTKMLNS